MSKSFLLLPNEIKDRDLSYTKQLAVFLNQQQQNVYVCEPLFHKLQMPVNIYTNDTPIDAAVVIGGDGTILRWAHRLMERQIPILGINFGRLGYLAEVEPAAAADALLQIIKGNYKVESRMVLQGTLTIGQHVQQVFACNDLVLHRGEMSGMLPVNAYINGTYMDTFLSDGVIVATPSGSTAYNFSAGGPIVNPIAENILLTPICSHSVLGRCIVTTGKDVFRFEIDCKSNEEYPVLSIDGVEKFLLTDTCSLEVKKSALHFDLIRVTDMSFFEILHQKMFV